MSPEALTSSTRFSGSGLTLLKAALRNKLPKRSSTESNSGREHSMTSMMRTLTIRSSKVGPIRHANCQRSAIAKLPSELLEEIFIDTLMSSHVSHQDFCSISLVCKTWFSVVYPFPLIRVNANGFEGVMEAVRRIQYLEAVRGKLSTWRMPTQILSINPRWLGAVPPIDELLILLGHRLVILDLYGDLGALSSEKCCVRADHGDIKLPMLRELRFDNGGPLDLSALLRISRATLVTLKIEVRFAFGILEHLDRSPIPSLRHLHITHPNIDFLTRYAICGIAVNLETLELHIHENEVLQTVEVLKELPSTLKKLELQIKTWRLVDEDTKAILIQPIRDFVDGRWEYEIIFRV